MPIRTKNVVIAFAVAMVLGMLLQGILDHKLVTVPRGQEMPKVIYIADDFNLD